MYLTQLHVLHIGGAVRVVLEMAGVRNCFGKQLGSANPLNNARATVEGLRALRTFKQARCSPHRWNWAGIRPSWDRLAAGRGRTFCKCWLVYMCSAERIPTARRLPCRCPRSVAFPSRS
jgi:Ribosomal protein S5, C-terminal domain